MFSVSEVKDKLYDECGTAPECLDEEEKKQGPVKMPLFPPQSGVRNFPVVLLISPPCYFPPSAPCFSPHVCFCTCPCDE